MPGLFAEFREEKRITLLREPLVSQGSIYFAPPDRLARLTHSPAPSAILLIGDRIAYEDRGERGSIDIDSHPMIRGMSDIFRALLAGDGDALRTVFEVQSLPRDGEGWEITLRPRHAPMRDSISAIRVQGTDAHLTELHIAERSGDETTMEFSAVDTERRFSADEVAKIFGLASP